MRVDVTAALDSEIARMGSARGFPSRRPVRQSSVGLDAHTTPVTGFVGDEVGDGLMIENGWALGTKGVTVTPPPIGSP